ncbi:MAG: coproporphyrinogen III oxidase, partial [Planctomycetaceae bacterium]
MDHGSALDAVPRAAYVHVPFCRHRCGYCDFPLVAGRDDLIGNYLRADRKS